MSTIRIWILKRALNKLSPDVFTSSSPECEKLDAYKMWIKTSENESVLVDKYNEAGCLEGWKYNSKSEKHDIQTELATSDENLSRVTVTHYYKCETLEYESLFQLALLNFSGFDKFKVSAKALLNRIAQLIHNSKSVHIKTRYELLRFIVDKYCIDRDFGLISLSTAIYTLRFFQHPQRPDVQKKLQLYLDSFVESGELKIKSNSLYKVTGKAIVTLEQFELEERRHADSLKVQGLVLVLTAVIALSAIVQAGIIKLKPLIDFS